jgi:hypothetical protein
MRTGSDGTMPSGPVWSSPHAPANSPTPIVASVAATHLEPRILTSSPGK